MVDRRWKDHDWFITTPDGKLYLATHPAQQLAVMMDIRDELKRLNAVLHCGNFLDIPHKLERIKRNTTKKRKSRAVGKPALRVVSR